MHPALNNANGHTNAQIYRDGRIDRVGKRGTGVRQLGNVRRLASNLRPLWLRQTSAPQVKSSIQHKTQQQQQQQQR